MIYTTLTAIRAHGPCLDAWRKLLAHLGKVKADNDPLALKTILDSNGLNDALWCLRAIEGHQPEIRLFGVACARDVQHLMTDPRSLAALDVAERHAYGQATDDELATAEAAAWAAARAAALAAALEAERAATRAAAGAAARAAALAAQAARFRKMFCQKEVTA